MAEFANHSDFISHLFALVSCDKTSVVACDVLEDLLIARHAVFNLASVRKIHTHYTYSSSHSGQLCFHHTAIKCDVF